MELKAFGRLNWSLFCRRTDWLVAPERTNVNLLKCLWKKEKPKNTNTTITILSVDTVIIINITLALCFLGCKKDRQITVLIYLICKHLKGSLEKSQFVTNCLTFVMGFGIFTDTLKLFALVFTLWFFIDFKIPQTWTFQSTQFL